MPWRQRDGWSTWDLSVPPPAAGFPSFPFFSLFPPFPIPLPWNPAVLPVRFCGRLACGGPRIFFCSFSLFYLLVALPFRFISFPGPVRSPSLASPPGTVGSSADLHVVFFFFFFSPSPSTAAVPSNLPRREPSARHPGRLAVFDSEIYRRFRARPEGGF